MASVSEKANDPSPRLFRAAYFYRVAVGIGLGLLIALFIWHPLATTDDFWNHVAVGRWTWETRKVPSETLFLWTALEPHVYHSWLGQLALFGLTNLTTPEYIPQTVLTFTMLVVFTCFAITCLVGRLGGGFSSLLVIGYVLAIEASAGRFQARPELFTQLFLSALLAFLVYWSGGLHERTDWPGGRLLKLIIPGVVLYFALWANLYGAVVLGVLVLAMTAACDLMQDGFDRRSRILLGLLNGRMFHDSDIASYLQWRLAGDQLLEEQQIEIVVLSSNRSPGIRSLAPLADFLDSHRRWCRVHLSRGGVIWVRRNSKYEAVWKPRQKLVRTLRFGELEEAQREREQFLPPIADDVDREHGPQPPPTWQLYERPARRTIKE